MDTFDPQRTVPANRQSNRFRFRPAAMTGRPDAGGKTFAATAVRTLPAANAETANHPLLFVPQAENEPGGQLADDADS